MSYLVAMITVKTNSRSPGNICCFLRSNVRRKGKESGVISSQDWQSDIRKLKNRTTEGETDG